MKVTIDRIEGNFAIVELPDKSMVNLPLQLISGCKEGNVINIEIDDSEMEDRAKRIDRLAKDLWVD